MAYLHRGKSGQDFDDYDPTPYSGGYDQAALYGRPKPPSDETCYPISSVGSQGDDGESRYGSETTPYLPSGIDTQRPTHGYEQPCHSTESGYGENRPSYGAGGQDFEPGYGRPQPKPAWQSSYESEDSYGAVKPSFESAYGRPKPSFEESFGESFGGPKPSVDDSYGRPKHGRPDLGGSFQPGYGAGFEGSRPGYGGGFDGSFGVASNEGQESYGGVEYGRKPAHQYGNEESFKQDDEYGYKKPSYGGFGEESSQEWGSGYQKPPQIPPPEEGYGGYGRPSGYRKDDWDDESADLQVAARLYRKEAFCRPLAGCCKEGHGVYGRACGYRKEDEGLDESADWDEESATIYGLPVDSEGHHGHERQVFWHYW